MATRSKVVLVECGSFNPITNMHLRMFEIARDYLHRLGQHEVVGGLISPVNDAYSKKDLLSSFHRIEMIKLALKSNEWIKVDTWECEQNIWSESLVVLNHLQSVVNSYLVNNESPKSKRLKLENDSLCESCNKSMDNPNVTVKLLCGADLLESFAKPGLWKEDHIVELVNKFGLVVVSREGSDPRKFIYESDVLTRLERNITIVTEWITNDISSTKIRRALRRGESVKYLLPDAVLEYIHKHRLFECDDNKYNYGLLTPSPNADNAMYPVMHAPTYCSSNNGQLLAPPTCHSLRQHSVPNSLPIIPPPMQYRQSAAAAAPVASVHQASEQVNHVHTTDHETSV